MNDYAVLAVCAVLLLAVAVVFGRTIGFGFVNYDDHGYVYENPHLKRGLSAEEIGWAFTTSHCNNWHPVTWLSYMLDYQFCGLEPWGYHLSNVLMHAAAAILLFLILRRMTGDLWPSAFAAAVFAVHPLRVESVVWVAERKDVLSGLFFMLTLAAYASYVRRPFSLLRYLTVVLLFALGVMAKSMLVTLPFVLLLLDYWPLGRMVLPSMGNPADSWGDSWGGSCTATPGATVQLSPQRTISNIWRLVVEKLPLFALSAASCVITPLAQGKAVERFDILPLSLRIDNALVSYAAYIGHSFYPVGLAVFYPHQRSGLPDWQIAGALLLLLCICVGAVVWRRNYPYFLVGWFWYLGMLVPVIGLVQVGSQAMADRYTYLPQIGLAIALAWGADRAIGTWPGCSWLRAGTFALVVGALMGCAWQQTSYWRNSEALWRHAVDCTISNAVAHQNLGAVLAENKHFDEAIAEYWKSLENRPIYPEAHYNLAAALAELGQLDKAIAEYERTLEIKPDYAEAHNNLGNALVKRGRFEEAIVHYQEALTIEPDYAGAHNNFGIALVGRGRLDEAIPHFRKAVELAPDFASARRNLELALGEKEQEDSSLPGSGVLPR